MRRLSREVKDGYLEIIEEPVYIQVSDQLVVAPDGSQLYTKNFTQADLTADTLVIAHNQGVPNGCVKVVMFNNENLEIQPTDVEIVDGNNARVSLKGYTPLTGIWRLKVL